MEVSWKVADTNQPPINLQSVNLGLSTDGGQTFPHVLASSTANDGQELVALPINSGDKVRLVVQSGDGTLRSVTQTNATIAPAKVEIYFSRHAEKAVGTNPELTTAGKARAKALAELMQKVGITAVYSTNVRRTIDTATPTAAALGLAIQTYSDESALISTLKTQAAGGRVLVIGHSDTLGAMINQLGVNQSITIAENEYENIFFVGLTDAAPQFSAWRLRMKPVSGLPVSAGAVNTNETVLGVQARVPAPPANDSATRAAQVLPAERMAAAPVAAAATAVRTLNQNWTPADAEEFYSLRQGSPLMRRPFFDALEQAGSTQLFRSQENMSRYGFLPRPATASNPEGYPIGFVGNESIEMNCSACHTSQLKYGNVTYLIDGGQAMTDIETFQRELAEAIAATLADAPPESSLPTTGRIPLDLNTKFGRFARALFSTTMPAVGQVRTVITLLKRDYDRRQTYNDFNDFGKRMNTAAERNSATRHHPYGFARLDALGGILNQATAVALDLDENARPSNAPVNYPAIWDAPQHVHVQWNGAVDNTSKFGPLGRNAGQVIGVFGIIKTEGTLVGYDSSINFDALNRAEALITKLWSPAWPAEFGLDSALAKTGETVYQKNCITCHAIMARDNPNRRANDVLIPIDQEYGPYGILGTDDLVAKNFQDRKAKVGPLAGRNETIPFRGSFPNQTDAQVFARDILSHLVFNAISRSFVPWREELNIDDAASARTFSQSVPTSLMRYKSRPLNGVWSTAPYLHNGSVLNMLQLLTPPDQRLKNFQVGSIEFDPQTLGFKNEGPFQFDTTLSGNSNSGHSYGTGLSENEKLALMEYLKTL